MIIFLQICLLVMPWIFLPIEGVINQFRLPQSTFMEFMFMGMIVLSLKDGTRFIYRNKYLAALVAWIFIRFAFNFFIPFSFEYFKIGRPTNVTAIEPLIQFLLGLFATMVVLSTFSKEDFEKVAKALCLSGVFVAVFSLMQYLGFDPMRMIAKYHCENKISACLDNPNVVGNYLALTSPLFFMFNERKYLLGAFLVFAGIGITNSHFAAFLALLGLFIFSFLNYRRNKIVMTSLVVIAVLVLLLLIKLDYAKLGLNVSGRLDCWKVAVELLKANPLFGRGVAFFQTQTVYIGSTYWLSVHNDWLERTLELGIVGLILMLMLVLNSIRNCSLEDRLGYSFFTMFIIFLVMMFGSFPMETASVGLLGLISFWAVEKL